MLRSKFLNFWANRKIRTVDPVSLKTIATWNKKKVEKVKKKTEKSEKLKDCIKTFMTIVRNEKKSREKQKKTGNMMIISSNK